MTNSITPQIPAAIIAPAPAQAEAVQTAPTHAPLAVSGQHMLFANTATGDETTQQMIASCAHELGKMLALVPEQLSPEAALSIMTNGLQRGRAAEVAAKPFALNPKNVFEILFGVKDQARLSDAARSQVFGGIIPPVAVGYYLRTAMVSVFGAPIIKAMQDDDALARTTMHGWVLGGFDDNAFDGRLLRRKQLATILCESLQPRQGHAFLPLPFGVELDARRAQAGGWATAEDVLRGISASQLGLAAREHAEAALFVAQFVLDAEQAPRLGAQRAALTAFSEANVRLQQERAEAAAARERLTKLSAVTTVWTLGDGA